MDKIVILTYNILSSSLATLMTNEKKDNKIVYPTEIMNNDNRFKKISLFIKDQILIYSESNFIICLQEVSEEWLPKFAQLFASLKYNYINKQYGRIFDGNMGVLIAYPNKLSIVKSQFIQIGRYINPHNDMSLLAASKRNVAIYLLLESKSFNYKFGVITYHMPCEPKNPLVGYYHNKIIYRKAIKFMSNNRWILAGDFNMLSDTQSYKYLVKKKDLGCIWKDKLHRYPITNFAYIKDNEFSGCIDYIFYLKDNLKCIDVKIDNINNIIPDKIQPSDHIPVIAIFN